ncbi:inositol monophosphatase family protein [Aquihabitans daechungensis]|uniref:inositol monophosphatase family protein n=1 Tax=Aquihabitans daechungensis TaxID=1052257 RepID=UPI003BA18765
MVGEPVEPLVVLGALTRATDAIEAALAATADWGPTGGRDGEHHSDVAADAAAVSVLVDAGYGVLSEESGRTHPERAVTVVVDPLDGSTNASRRMSWWAASLCAVDAEGPLVAAVTDLRNGIRYTAIRGRGAARDGTPIRPSGCRDLSQAIIGINGVPAGHGGWAQYRAFGATALDLCAVADGTLDGYLDATTDELGAWDYLGALLVCREAGVDVVDAAGRDLLTLEHADRRTPVAGATPELRSALLGLHPVHGR